MKIFICGQKAFGAAVFQMLAGHGRYEIVGVSCPKYAGDKLDSLYKVAKASVEMFSHRDLTAADIPKGTHLIVCAHSHSYIGPEIRGAAHFGAIGYHPSLLPRHRGKDAIKWAIKMGDPITGGTVYWLDDGVDTGPIAAQKWCWIEPGMTASDLWRTQLFPIGVSLIDKVVDDISGGFQERIPQLEAVATWEPSLDVPPLSDHSRIRNT